MVVSEVFHLFYFFGANKKKEDTFFAVQFHLFVFFFWNRDYAPRIRIADFCASSGFINSSEGTATQKSAP